MKILLIKPPINPNLISTALYEPLELEYLAASISHHQVDIFDMRIENNLFKKLKSFEPELVGLTAYTCDYNLVKKLLKEIKNFDKRIKTVVGGHHATFMPKDFVLPEVDAIFMGYADSTFPCYIKALENPSEMRKIPNIGIVENGSVYFTIEENIKPEIEMLPLPARDLTKKYRKYYHDAVRNQLALIMSSRGCPFRCNFCACWKLMNGKCVMRSPESIIHELKNLPQKTDVIYFSDDNTFNDISRMWKLSDLIKKNGIKKYLQMYARADTIVKHPDLFAELKTSGLQFLTVGIESFQDSDLDNYNKKTSVKVNNEAIRILKKLGIYILAHLIVRPEYTREDFDKLFNYVHENKLFRPAFPVLTPLPGTELFEQTQDDFQIKNYDFFDFTHSILPTKLDSKEFYRQLSGLYKKSYSISRLAKHKLNRMISKNESTSFTSNTDGINILKIILVNLFTYRKFIKLRDSYQNIIVSGNK
ncbi:MAG: radical SAM protein [Bacteroidota bacterium]